MQLRPNPVKVPGIVGDVREFVSKTSMAHRRVTLEIPRRAQTGQKHERDRTRSAPAHPNGRCLLSHTPMEGTPGKKRLLCRNEEKFRRSGKRLLQKYVRGLARAFSRSGNRKPGTKRMRKC